MHRYCLISFILLVLLCGCGQVPPTASPTVTAEVLGTLAALSTANAHLNTQLAATNVALHKITFTSMPSATPVPPTLTALPPAATPTATRRRITYTPGPTLVAPTLPAPTLVAPANPTSAILSFTADRTEAQPSDTLTLSWNTRAASQVRLEHYRQVNGLRVGEVAYHYDLPGTGTLAVPLGETECREHVFHLYAYDASYNLIGEQYLTVSIRLPAQPTPAILGFSASSLTPAPGEAVIFSWVSDHGEVGRLTDSWPGVSEGESQVSANGTWYLTYANFAGPRTFTLTIYNRAGEQAQSSLTLNLRCAYAYFFSAHPPAWAPCPTAADQTLHLVEQRFERGRMLYLNGILYVLFNATSTILTHADTWTAAEPDSDPAITPPAGYYQPVRGFGKLWRTAAQLRDSLGWALAPEQGYAGRVQRSASYDYQNYHNAQFLNLSDGQIVGLYDETNWEFLSP